MGKSRLKRKLEGLGTATQGLDAQGLLRQVASAFQGRIALASSLGPEDQVLLDMLSRMGLAVRVFTLDTGRLPQETYDLIERSQSRYGVRIHVYAPRAASLEALVNEQGPNCFYRSVDLRKRCCYVRKVEPLARALEGLDAWICGLRTEQALTRGGLERIARDGQFHLIKVCPLADWTTQEVWDYVSAQDVPTSDLHEKGYPSIGCSPCTRAIRPGEDLRAGRWWWEAPEHKECGLHRREDGTLGPKES